MITYGLSKQADVHPDHIRPIKTGFLLDVFIRRGAKFHKIKDVELSLLGEHNIANAMAAVAVGAYMGFSDRVIKKTLASFKGIQRRLTYRGAIGKDIAVYDDYAHHPTEIKATLSALRPVAKNNLIAVFQPHRYSRLKDLWDDFLTAFENADRVIVCPVYPAGETPLPEIRADLFAKELATHHPNVDFISDLKELKEALLKQAASHDSVVCLGAGSISGAAVEMVKGK